MNITIPASAGHIDMGDNRRNKFNPFRSAPKTHIVIDLMAYQIVT